MKLIAFGNHERNGLFAMSETSIYRLEYEQGKGYYFLEVPIEERL